MEERFTWKHRTLAIFYTSLTNTKLRLKVRFLHLMMQLDLVFM